MFNIYAHFAHTPAERHPGQPVHSELHFDVWRDKAGKFYLIPEGSDPILFDSQAIAIDAGKKLVADAPKPTPELIAARAKGPILAARYQPAAT